jgi:predicted ATPase/class 3 adenylate cyclase
VGAATGAILTFLFTDIEGSTRLARAHGDRWPQLLARHHELLRTAIEGHGGSIDGTEGDAFFALFQSAPEGVAAAVAAQRGLTAEPWPDPTLRVRMGLHTGEVQQAATGYVGIEIHRAARVASSAHGGQVLLTRAVLDGCEAGVDVEDLGRHRLKDFPEPEQLLHLVVDGRGADQFAAPKTLPVRPTNIPVVETALVGRRAELEELHDRLANGTRLMTLVGQGGTGKTRLAIAAAERLLDAFPGGAWFVPLADVDDGERMLATVAENLRLADTPGLLELDALAERLSGDRTLLVLDNLEQLRPASTVIRDLLAAAPPLKVLATSQAPLRLAAERVMSLDPLSREEARELFVDSAMRRRPGFEPAASAEAIDAICARLDGLPLAIELAAARISVLTPEDLLDRLTKSLELLRTRDPERPARQRSLRAAIDWSFALLSPEARDLLADLSLFATPFGVSDAEALGEGDVLDALEELLDFSFIRRIDTGIGETRFTMAQTLREFGREQLIGSDRIEATRRRHAVWALALCEQAFALREGDPLAASDQVWDRLDDVYAALDWAREPEPELHLRICSNLCDVLIWPPPGPQAETHLQEAIERDPPPGPELARVLRAVGILRLYRGEASSAIELLQRAVAIWRDLGDDAERIDTLGSLAHAALFVEGDVVLARACAEQGMALARASGDQTQIDSALMMVALIEVADGDVAVVEPLIGQTLERTTDEETALGLRHLWADCALIGGDPGEAAGRYADAIRALPALDDSPQVANELQGLAMSLARAGRAQDALEVDRIATAHREHFNAQGNVAFWERLREENLGIARTALPDYVPSHPVEDLAAARDWALERADEIRP